MHFITRQKDDRQSIQIYLNYSYANKRTLFFSGETINTLTDWNKKTNMVREDKPLIGGKEINSRLGIFKSKVDLLVTQIRMEGKEPTTIEVKERLTATKTKSKREAQFGESEVLTAFNEFIAYSTDVLSRKKNTLKTYHTVYTHLYCFQKHNKQKVRFNRINEDFINKYCQYLQTKHIKQTKLIKGKILLPTIKETGINDNALATSLKNFKTFLLWSYRQGYFSNRDFIERIEVKTNEVDIVVLTTDQLKHLAHLEVPTRLQLVKDMYVVGSFTGLRIGDILDLNKQQIHIDPNNLSTAYIERTTIKTNSKINLPLIKEVAGIFLKYQCLFPPVGRSSFAEKLKEIGELADFTQLTQKTTLKKKAHVTSVKPFYQLMTPHQMRRNFISMLVKKGIKAELIMDLTSHKDYRSFQKYIKINDADRISTIQVLADVLS